MPRGHDLGLNFAGIKSSDDGRGESGRFEMDGHHLDANDHAGFGIKELLSGS